MIKNILPAVIIVAVCGLGTSPALASRSITKSYKVSAYLPPAVGHLEDKIQHPQTDAASFQIRQTTEEQIIIRDNRRILLRTTVAP